MSKTTSAFQSVHGCGTTARSIMISCNHPPPSVASPANTPSARVGAHQYIPRSATLQLSERSASGVSSTQGGGNSDELASILKCSMFDKNAAVRPKTLGEAIWARFSPNLALLFGLTAAYVSGALGLGLFSLVVIVWVAYALWCTFFGRARFLPDRLLLLCSRFCRTSQSLFCWRSSFYSVAWADQEALSRYRAFTESEDRIKVRLLCRQYSALRCRRFASQSSPEYESGEWLSQMLKKMWPHVNQQWANSIKGSLTWSLSSYITNSKSSLLVRQHTVLEEN